MRAIVVLIPLLLAALPGLAYASPPDPSWISGLYDDADHDDVVALVASGVGDVSPAPATGLRPLLSTVGRVAPGRDTADHTPPASAVRWRAPPAS